MIVRSISKSARRFFKKTVLPAFLAAALALPLLPPVPAEASYGGDAEPFYQSSVEKLVGWDVLRGYPDGALIPENPITRAEFVAMVNRAYGYSDAGSTPFRDVNEGDWFAGDIAAAYTAGYFNGTSPTTASPNDNLTREQAMTILAKNMRLDEMEGEVTEFSDGRDFSGWSRGYVRSAAQKGLVAGYPDGSFRPGGNITRGEMATLLARALGTLVAGGGDRSLGDVYGNVTLNTPGTVLRDTTVAGDLYVSGGLGLQGMTLDNVNVLGNIIVAGGGEAQAGDSLLLRNTTADNLVVDSLAGQYLSLRAEGNTQIDRTDVRSDAYIMDRTATGSGLKTIEFSPDNPAGVYTVAGNLENVVNRSPASSLTVGSGALRTLTVDEDAVGALLRIDQNTAVRTLNLDTGTTVTGTGSVDRLNVNTAGSSTEMLPDAIDIRPGIVSTVAGEEMNTVQGQQSSDTPRILTGYPTTRAVATATATGVFSCNKTGTLYWGVTLAADGSPTDKTLLDPEGNSRLVCSGNLKVTEANKEITANLTKLTAGTGYYLSAVLVDARGNHSAVKSWHFNSTDNTVPNFASGYPKLEQNDYDKTSSVKNKYHVQVSSVATKDCDLYWALYEGGATAPTAADFRSGKLTGSVAHGTARTARNEWYPIDVYGLKEKTGYIMYLWLNDADNAKSSAVRNVPITTTDGTPPEFLYDTPAVNTASITANAIPLSVTLSENGTVYWVAVKRSAADGYLKPLAEYSQYADAAERWWDAACRQIEGGGGSNVVRRGSASVRENVAAAINASGLTPATLYTIFYVAKDAAGNYSRFSENAAGTGYRINGNTLDTAPPTLRQDFTRFPGTSTPYADTDIQLIFSEPVMCASDNRAVNDPDQYVTFVTLYDAVRNSSDQESAKNAFAAALRKTIQLFNANDTTGAPVNDRALDGETGWIIDYREATVDVNPDTNVMTLTLPTRTDGSGAPVGALNLNSDATYYFVVDDIADISSSKNPLVRTTLPTFRTIAAQVKLTRLGVTSIGSGADAIPIDMSFSMTPDAANMADDVRFDLILWSDTSVTFEVYELTPSASGGNDYTGSLLPSAASAANVDIVNDGGNGFVGRSLYHDFYQTDFPYAKNMETKYYGIHFTAVEGESEIGKPENRAAWDKMITFHVSVVTDSNGYLGDLTDNGVDEDKFDYYTAPERGVTEIQTDKPFEMTKRFSNATSPVFNNRYPQFTSADTSVTVTVQSDRPGTLYYAIVPASIKTISTTGTTYSYNTAVPTTAYRSDSYKPELKIERITNADGCTAYASLGGGTELVETYVLSENNTRLDVPSAGSGLTGGDTAPFYVDEPISRRIYSPNFDSTVKTGRITLTGSESRITVDNLMADTLYLVYIVMQGTGQTYSPRPMLYQFTTKATYSPDLVLRSLTPSTVRMTSGNMNAITNYAVFQLDQLAGTLLGSNFKTEAPGAPDSVPDYTVWQAIQNTDTSGRSYFDLYAPDDLKRDVADLIENSSGTTSGGWIGGRTEQALPQGATGITVDCTGLNIASNVDYFFAACAWYDDPASTDKSSRNVLAESIAFRGVAPVHTTDTSTPKLDSITGHLTVNFDAAGNAAVSGTLSIQFDKEIYYYNRSQNTRRAIVLADRATVPSTNPTYMSVEDLCSTTPTGFTFVTNSANAQIRTSEIRLGMNQLYGTATFSGQISSDNSQPIGSNLIFTVNIPSSAPAGTGPVDARLTGPSNIWASGENIQVTATVTRPATNPTGISLNTTSLNLIKGQNGTLTATLSPAGASGTVVWTTSTPSGSQGRVILNNTTGDTVTFTGDTFGTATVTATSNGVSASCTVTVSAQDLYITNITGNRITNLPLTLGTATNTTGYLSAVVTPSVTGNADLVWSEVNDPANIITILGNGANATITASGAGTAIVQVAAGNTVSTCIITVT